MLSDEELLNYNQCGWIPGPDEDEKSFCTRVALGKNFYRDPLMFFEERKLPLPFSFAQKLLKPRWNWSASYLINLFDFAPHCLCAFFDNQDLSIFQGATTWICAFDKSLVPFIQLRRALHKGSFLKIYSLEEILAHEAVHAARAAFQEPKFEEFFAYATSSTFLRRFLGPIAGSPKGMLFFGMSLFSFMLFQVFSFFSLRPFLFLSLLTGFGMFAAFALILLRLTQQRFVFRKAFQKLSCITKSKKKAMAILFRLKDDEIKEFARMQEKEIIAYVEKEPTLRFRLLRLAYFQN